MKLKNSFILIILILSFNTSFGEVIFEDNFDSQPDFSLNPEISEGNAQYTCDVGDVCPNLPIGWSSYYINGIFWNPEYKNTVNINSEQDHTIGSGKAFIKYDESQQAASGSYFSADGTLAVVLPEDRPEIYARFWIKYDENFTFDSDDVYSGKIFRIQHWDRGSYTYFLYFGSGVMGPAYIFNNYNSPVYGWRHNHAYRCDPQGTDYYCPNNIYTSMGNINGYNYLYSGSPNFKEHMGDRNWHRLDFYVKMNTYNGSGNWNADGIVRYFYDGVQVYEDLYIKWINSGTDDSIGWNIADIGGNTQNHWTSTWQYNHYYNVGDTVIYNSYNWTCIQAHTAMSTPGLVSNSYWEKGDIYAGQKEQWYAIDDIVISDTPIPENYVIGSSLFSESFSSFDMNNNHLIDTQELLNIINAWKREEISMTQTFNYLNKWKKKERI